MKKIKIENYTIIIDEKNYYFGFLVNKHDENLVLLSKLDFEYKINFKENRIELINNIVVLTFENIAKEYLYFSFKTPHLFILVEGENKELIKAYEITMSEDD